MPTAITLAWTGLSRWNPTSAHKSNIYKFTECQCCQTGGNDDENVSVCVVTAATTPPALAAATISAAGTAAGATAALHSCY